MSGARNCSRLHLDAVAHDKHVGAGCTDAAAGRFEIQQWDRHEAPRVQFGCVVETRGTLHEWCARCQNATAAVCGSITQRGTRSPAFQDSSLMACRTSTEVTSPSSAFTRYLHGGAY